MEARKHKNILFSVLLLCLSLPAIQRIIPFMEFVPLKGAFTLTDPPDFSWENWQNGSFQRTFEKSINDHVGFHNFFIRLNNQIDFSFFNIAHSDNVIIGKKGYLFDKGYINTYIGIDFAQKEVLEMKLRKLSLLQKELKKRKNIDLITILAPGKASFYSEYIPNVFLDNANNISNYSYLVKRSKDFELNMIDFNSYFLQMKDTARYPLYPKCSIHWSSYGALIAADSLIKYIEKTRRIKLPTMVFEGIELTPPRFSSDYDIGEGMNLFWKIPHPPSAYPKIKFIDTTNAKPVVLTISDSFYNNFYYADIPQHLFTQEGFWYYNKEIYPEPYSKLKKLENLNFQEEVEKSDIIILMCTEVNLHKLSFGFIEHALELYEPVNEEGRIKFMKELIKTDNQFVQEIRKNHSGDETITDSLLTQEAIKLVNNEAHIHFNYRRQRQDAYEKSLWNNTALLKIEVKKAKERGITLSEMIRLDAQYIYFDQEEQSPKMKEVREIEASLKNDTATFNNIKEKAKKNSLSIEEQLFSDALWTYNYKEQEKYSQIQEIVAQLRNNFPKEILEAKAKEKGVSYEEILLMDAKWLYDQKHLQQ